MKKTAKRGASESIPGYFSWLSIIQRCCNPNNAEYKNYGARGISVCPEWRSSFDAFILDMGPKPSSRHSVERRDNNGDYEPRNCYWATSAEQANNKRTNVLVTFNGETRSISAWAKKIGISVQTLFARRRYGWTWERILTTPVILREGWCRNGHPKDTTKSGRWSCRKCRREYVAEWRKAKKAKLVSG